MDAWWTVTVRQNPKLVSRITCDSHDGVVTGVLEIGKSAAGGTTP